MAQSSGQGRYLTLKLHNNASSNSSSSEILSAMTIPTRTLILSDVDWSVTVGRSTSSEIGPRAKPDNAYFQSKVVSRHHAVVEADPVARRVTITDVDSMHGTYHNGVKLTPHEPHEIFDGDEVMLGAEVARGDTTFNPVRVGISYAWSDESVNPPSSPHINEVVRNTFSADFSDDDSNSDDAEEAYQQHRDPSVEVVEHHTNLVVLDSDDSDIISIVSDEPGIEVESPTSSPFDSHEQDSFKGKDVELGTNEDPKQLPTSEIDWDQDSLYDHDDVFDEEIDTSKGKLTSTSAYNIAAIAEVMDEHLDARQPSPSDAAMVKPTGSVHRAPPFSASRTNPDFYYYPRADRTDKRVTQVYNGNSRNETAWAGHNSVLHEPCEMLDNPGMPIAASGSQHQEVPQYSPWRTLPLPTAFSKANNENQGLTSNENPDRTGKKRKLDDIEEVVVDPSLLSQDVEGKSDAIQDAGDAQVVPPISFEWQPNDLIPVEVTQTLDSLKSPPPPQTEPPRKKHKKNKEGRGANRSNNGSGFMRFAATAMFGVAVGAVGTVFTLASLPQDFFV